MYFAAWEKNWLLEMCNRFDILSTSLKIVSSIDIAVFMVDTIASLE